MIQKRTQIKGLAVHDLDSDTHTFHYVGEIPKEYLWAFNHIVEHECGCLSCGKTVFEVKYKPLMSEVWIKSPNDSGLNRI